jgi:hypothetical protein
MKSINEGQCLKLHRNTHHTTIDRCSSTWKWVLAADCTTGYDVPASTVRVRGSVGQKASIYQLKSWQSRIVRVTCISLRDVYINTVECIGHCRTYRQSQKFCPSHSTARTEHKRCTRVIGVGKCCIVSREGKTAGIAKCWADASFRGLA